GGSVIVLVGPCGCVGADQRCELVHIVARQRAVDRALKAGAFLGHAAFASACACFHRLTAPALAYSEFAPIISWNATIASLQYGQVPHAPALHGADVEASGSIRALSP